MPRTFLSIFFLTACVSGDNTSVGENDHSAAVSVDYFVESSPDNVSWGWFPIEKEPVLRIQSGQTVSINTLTSAGATQREAPAEYLPTLGIDLDQVLDDVTAFWETREDRPREGRDGHIITGPIYIEGAEPGDMLEVEILDVTTRVNWGINSTSANGGVLSPTYPGAREGDRELDIPSGSRHIIKTEGARNEEFAIYPGGIRVPLAPFMGIYAVAPNPVLGEPGVEVEGVQGSVPPGAFGGNLDIKHLKAGSSVYLPVFHPGALFYVGDPHGAQGDGEVSGTAIEQSLTGVFRFNLHKDREINTPWAENDTHYLLMGIDVDLDRAVKKATWAVVDFLEDTKGLDASTAMSLASVATDYTISEVVDYTQVVTAFIPKGIFPD